MGQWQADDADRRFADMVMVAGSQGPQVVMRGADPVAVVLSPEDYRRLVRQADANFGRLLGQSPLSPGDAEPVGMDLGA